MFSYNQLWSFKALLVVFGELVIQRRPRQSHLKALVNLGSCHSCRKSMYAYTEHLEVSRFCCAAETQGIPGGHAEAVTPRTCLVCYKHRSWFQTSSNFKYFEISEDMFQANMGSQALDHLLQRWGGNGGTGRRTLECKAQGGSRGKRSLLELAFNSCVENHSG